MKIESIKNAFITTFNDKKTKVQGSIPRTLIAKYAAGNINLQLGRFSSEADLEKRRTEICRYHFVD